MNASIILQGAQPNFVNALSQGTQAAAQTNAVQKQNALAQLYQTQGAGIAQGNQQSINALAALDPNLAIGVNQAQLGMDSTRLGMDQTRQNMQFSAEEMQMKRDQARAKTAQYAASLSAQEAAAQRDKIAKGLEGAGYFFANGDRAGYTSFLQQQGLDPAQYPFDAFPAHAAQFEGAIDALSDHEKRAGGGERTVIKGADGFQYYQDTGERVLPNVEVGVKYRPATQDEIAKFGVNGQVDTETGKFYPVKPPQKGMKMVSDGKGGFTFTQGDVGDDGGRVNPSSTESMISTIEGILNDPALDYSTGILSPLQGIPGTPQKRFQGRARQLEGQAFLQAFESLKGGGQITEIEGAKATQAMGRLDTAQSAGDYRAALTELRDILKVAQTRPEGWARQQGQGGGTAQINSDADYNALPSGATFIAPDGTTRRKP